MTSEPNPVFAFLSAISHSRNRLEITLSIPDFLCDENGMRFGELHSIQVWSYN